MGHSTPNCLSPTLGLYPNPCSLSWWCYPTISSSVVPFSCLKSFSASGSFPMSQLFASGRQSIGALASVLPMNIQGWFPLELNGLISLQSKGLSRVFPSSTSVLWCWASFMVQLSDCKPSMIVSYSIVSHSIISLQYFLSISALLGWLTMIQIYSSFPTY